jgi:hypothetical protein
VWQTDTAAQTVARAETSAPATVACISSLN